MNGVSVGRVQSVTADDFKAKVTMDIKTSTRIRQGSQARLRYDTPLGELFVQITPSGRGAVAAPRGPGIPHWPLPGSGRPGSVEGRQRPGERAG